MILLEDIAFDVWTRRIFSYLTFDDERCFLTCMEMSFKSRWFDFVTRMCNIEQKAVIWKICFGDKSLLIMGEPGTGKTFVLRLARDILTKLSVTSHVCALTALAGQNANGVTLHRTFPLFRFDKNGDWNKDTAEPRIGKKVYFTPLNGVLFIDEASMVSAVMFEKIMFLQKPWKSNFKIVALGDFYQLPPIEDDKDDDYPRKFFFQHYYMHKFSLEMLTIPERHNEPAFLDIIRHIRINDYNSNVMNFLTERKQAFEFLNTAQRNNKLYLYHDNKRVDEHNRKFVERLTTPPVTFPMFVNSIRCTTRCKVGYVSIDASKELQSYNIHTQQDVYRDVPLLKGIFEEQRVNDMTIRVGCQIMFNKNIYSYICCSTPEECDFGLKCKHTDELDIVNGTRGQILKIYPQLGFLLEIISNQKKTSFFFDYRREYSIIISSVTKCNYKLGSYVAFDNGKNGKILGLTNDEISVQILPSRELITLALDSKRIQPLPRIKTTIARVRYLPIVFSYALTIQKSQGMTLDNVVLSLSYIPSPSLVTVAVSRCRTSGGVYINGTFNKPHGQIDPLIVNFYLQINQKNNVKKRKQFNDLNDLISNFKIKMTKNKHGQLMVTSDLCVCPYFAANRSFAIKYIYDLCFQHISKTQSDLLHLCSMPNFIAALSHNG